MAEPVIISYARGLLKEFPGVPEGTVDVIPVDLVVGAICAVAARGPVNEDGSPDVTQVASGSANPLKYERLVELVQAWFAEHPLYDNEGQPISVRRVGLHRPGPGRAASCAGPPTCWPGPTKVVHALPLRGAQAKWSSQLEEKREMAERALTYVELYGAYTACEAIYGVDHLLALHESLAGRRPARPSACDPRIDRVGPLRPTRSTCRRW